MLTKRDLEKIGKLFDEKIDRKIADNNLLLFGRLATKDDLKELWEKACRKFATKEQLAKVQNIVIMIKNKLDKEYRFIQDQGEKNSREIEEIKQTLNLNTKSEE